MRQSYLLLLVLIRYMTQHRVCELELAVSVGVAAKRWRDQVLVVCLQYTRAVVLEVYLTFALLHGYFSLFFD